MAQLLKESSRRPSRGGLNLLSSCFTIFSMFLPSSWSENDCCVFNHCIHCKREETTSCLFLNRTKAQNTTGDREDTVTWLIQCKLIVRTAELNKRSVLEYSMQFALQEYAKLAHLLEYALSHWAYLLVQQLFKLISLTLVSYFCWLITQTYPLFL